MTKPEKRIFNGLALAVSISGVAYFVMKYLMETEDPFALVNHPLQPFALNIHILASPFLLLVGGMLGHSHVKGMLKARASQRRPTGMVTMCAFLLLALSGYLLQVATSELLQQSLLVIHLGTGVFFILFYAMHLLFKRKSHLAVSEESRKGTRRRAA